MILFYSRIISIFFIFTIAYPAHSFEASITDEKISLAPHLSYYEDIDGTLTFKEILTLTSKGGLTQNTDDVLHFGFTDSAIWVHVPISFSDTVDQVKSWTVSIDYPPIKNIDLYINDSHEIKHIVSGTHLPFQSRPIKYRNFAYPLMNDGNTKYDLWLRVQSDTSLQIPINLWSNKTYFEYETFSSYGWGIFFGILIALGLYNLFLFVSVKDTVYLYYVLYLGGLSGIVLFLNGQGFQFIWHDNESWNSYALLCSTCFAGFWALQFSRSFLETKKYIPKFDTFIVVVMLGAVLCTLIGTYGINISLPKLSGLIAGLFVICVVTTAVKSYLIGHPIAPYFGIAWSLFLSGILVYLASIFGLAPTNYWTENAIQFGSATEAILLSLGLAQRIKLERKKRYEALESEHETVLKWQQAEKKLIERASYDSLTKLPNSTLLYKCIEDYKAADLPKDKRFGLILIRFKRFHEVSKTLGNSQANRLFIRAADRLANEAGRLSNVLPICTSNDYFHFLSVIDNSSFAVLVKINDNPQAHTEVANALLNVMKAPIEHEGILIDINAMAGIVLFPDHGDNLDTLSQRASIALDNPIRSPQSIFTYSEDQNYYSTRRLSLMGDLLKAIDSDKLELYLQPQINLTTGEIAGAEALVRWEHETHGFVPPEEFIPLCEQSGIIRPLTSWVFDKALEFDSRLQLLGHDVRLSINISVKNIAEENFFKSKLKKLEISGGSPERLMFEMTESIMMDEIDMSLTALKELNELGIKLSIDDFGTGHSSLAYLSQLPVHELKIDRSFVSGMLEQPHNQKIVAMTINLAHTLGLCVVAEGIEDESTLSHLKTLNCDVAQGYYIAQPMPYNSFVNWLKDNKTSVHQTKQGDIKS